MMKNLNFSFKVVLMLIVINIFIGSTPQQTQDKGKEMIYQFYMAYITYADLFDHILTRESVRPKLDSLVRVSCTQKWLNTISTIELEADPFLCAQDIDTLWKKKLEVSRIDSVQYNVSYGLQHLKNKEEIRVFLKEDENGVWKIDSVALFYLPN